MGQEIQEKRFGRKARERFTGRLYQHLETLGQLLKTPGFGVGERSLGAELEMSFVLPGGRPALINREVLEQLGDPCFTMELNRFNLEYNAPFTPFAQEPFSVLSRRLEEGLSRTRQAAAELGAKVVTIGILPTLVRSDLGARAMTDTVRYRALERELLKKRKGPFHIRIHGEDPLEVLSEHVTFEGANTSLQLHLRVNPAEFIDVYNAAQLATAPVLALAANSPIFLEHRLWEETRVALFKQAVDDRQERPGGPTGTARVGFGSAWIKSPLDLFEESVKKHDPLLPACTDEVVADSGSGPALAELRLHHGTVWRWNRAVYDPTAGGHLRIEFRALPAGPTVRDMMANAALMIGLALGLASDARAFMQHLSFDHVHDNFYRAAQHGPRAVLWWLDGTKIVRCKASDLVAELITTAERGLIEGGVAPSETGPLLDVIRERVRSGQTGAAWQRRTVLEFEAAGHSRANALLSMLRRYMELSEANTPVHGWALEPAGGRPNR